MLPTVYTLACSYLDFWSFLGFFFNFLCQNCLLMALRYRSSLLLRLVGQCQDHHDQKIEKRSLINNIWQASPISTVFFLKFPVCLSVSPWVDIVATMITFLYKLQEFRFIINYTEVDFGIACGTVKFTYKKSAYKELLVLKVTGFSFSNL